MTESLNSFYLLAGEESYLIRNKLDNIEQDIKKSGVNDIHRERINDQSEDFLQKLIQSVQTISLMTEYKLVIVECEELFAKKSEYDSKVIELFSRQLEKVTVVFILNSSPDKRIKIYKEFKKNGKFFEFKRPKYRDLDNWIRNKFKESSKTVDNRLVKYLEYLFDNRLEALDKEIEKIITLNYEKDKIGLKDSYQILSRDGLMAENIIFNMLDNWVAGKKNETLKEYRELIKDGQSPIYILIMIHRQLELLIKVKELKEKRRFNHKKIAKEINEHPYPVKKVYQQCGEISFSRLELFLENLWEVNYKIVTGKGGSPEELVEEFLLKFNP
ncbi:MAG: DNA polymerase III subunit delta [Halanaerobiaceae bacterium]